MGGSVEDVTAGVWRRYAAAVAAQSLSPSPTFEPAAGGAPSPPWEPPSPPSPLAEPARAAPGLFGCAGAGGMELGWRAAAAAAAAAAASSNRGAGPAAVLYAPVTARTFRTFRSADWDRVGISPF